MTIFPKDIIGQISFHVNLESLFIITVHHMITRNQDNNRTIFFLLKSQVCRHDTTYRNNDKEFIFERDSDEVSNN